MTECERLRAEAPGLASLPAEDPERLAAWSHAGGCEGCAHALREAERLQEALAEAEPPALPASALARIAEGIEADLRREGRRRSAWSALAAVALMAIMVAAARHRGGSPVEWLTAAALAVAALAVAVLAARRPLPAVAGAAAVAVAGALVTGGPGPVELGVGLECLLTELGFAAVVLGAGWLALRGGATWPSRSALAAAAAAGALAGDAALQVTCRAHGVGLHLLAFHAGGVVLAGAAASLVRRGRPVDA